mmetsp:Transcript_23806/g.44467  ORF Transcript_23806/g.44467 Transcript_23806/m.44467 type:complete len:147 (-) Transcript_23806:142-582(-)
MRIAEKDAVFGVFCRRWGVPLIDGGTSRLPRIIGHGRAMDLILTGRAVGADETLAMGLISRVVEKGQSLSAAIKLAHTIAKFPQICLRLDRGSVYNQWGLSEREALRAEYRRAVDAKVLDKESMKGARAFSRHGEGRGGSARRSKL